VTKVAPFKYRAFLSYSHRDKTWGEWLHRALESYRVDKDLVGRVTPAGPVPETLRPIFRDREDFSAGPSLAAQTITALEASQFLIVICSPDGARSTYVNEEIRHFKALGRTDRVIPIIVAGEPGQAGDDCFPPALRFKLRPDGSIGSERDEPIAADARPQGHGRDLARQKIVAGLLGVGLDEIVRRAARAQRRRNRIWASIAGVFLVLAVVATSSAVYAWQQLKTNEAFLDATLERFTSMVNRAVSAGQSYSLPVRVTLGFLEEAEGMLNIMAQYGRPTPRLRQRQIAMLIAFADSYRDLGRTADAEKRIMEAQRFAAELARDDAANPQWRWEQARVHQRRGDVEMARGNLAAARHEFNAMLEILEQLTTAQPDNGAWQHDLALAHERIGIVQTAIGQFAEAFANYKKVLALRQRLLARAPQDRERQHALAIAYERMGEIHRAYGDFPQALVAFQAALAIAERLTKAEPDSIPFLRGLGVAHQNVGTILQQQGEYAQAFDHFQRMRVIDERLAASDPQNVEWQRGLSIVHERIGDVLMAMKKPTEAIESFQALLVIRQRLVAGDPDNVGRLSDLALGYERIGGALVELKRTDEAIAALEKTLAIYATLLTRSPDDAGILFGSTIPLMRLGLLHGPKGAPYLEKALAILKELNATGRLDLRRQPMIGMIETTLAQLRKAQEKAPH